jgi:hypothetical protein
MINNLLVCQQLHSLSTNAQHVLLSNLIIILPTLDLSNIVLKLLAHANSLLQVRAVQFSLARARQLSRRGDRVADLSSVHAKPRHLSHAASSFHCLNQLRASISWPLDELNFAKECTLVVSSYQQYTLTHSKQHIHSLQRVISDTSLRPAHDFLQTIDNGH